MMHRVVRFCDPANLPQWPSLAHHNLQHVSGRGHAAVSLPRYYISRKEAFHEPLALCADRGLHLGAQVGQIFNYVVGTGTVRTHVPKPCLPLKTLHCPPALEAQSAHFTHGSTYNVGMIEPLLQRLTARVSGRTRSVLNVLTATFVGTLRLGTALITAVCATIGRALGVMVGVVCGLYCAWRHRESDQVLGHLRMIEKKTIFVLRFVGDGDEDGFETLRMNVP